MLFYHPADIFTVLCPLTSFSKFAVFLLAIQGFVPCEKTFRCVHVRRPTFGAYVYVLVKNIFEMDERWIRCLMPPIPVLYSQFLWRCWSDQWWKAFRNTARQTWGTELCQHTACRTCNLHVVPAVSVTCVLESTRNIKLSREASFCPPNVVLNFEHYAWI